MGLRGAGLGEPPALIAAGAHLRSEAAGDRFGVLGLRISSLRPREELGEGSSGQLKLEPMCRPAGLALLVTLRLVHCTSPPLPVAALPAAAAAAAHAVVGIGGRRAEMLAESARCGLSLLLRPLRSGSVEGARPAPIAAARDCVGRVSARAGGGSRSAAPIPVFMMRPRLMPCNWSMTLAKTGLFLGSASQQSRVSFSMAGGVVGGSAGRLLR